jgi:signal transduction histidine kinase
MQYTLQNAPTALHDYVIYNTVQEALTNILRHSNANHVTVDVIQDHRTIIVTIHDNGTGDGDIDYGFGLNTMQQRMVALGGLLHTESSPIHGFTVQGKLPVFYDLEASDGES